MVAIQKSRGAWNLRIFVHYYVNLVESHHFRGYEGDKLLNCLDYTEGKEAFQRRSKEAFHKGHCTLCKAMWGSWATWEQESLDHRWYRIAPPAPWYLSWLSTPTSNGDSWPVGEEVVIGERACQVSTNVLVILHSNTWRSKLNQIQGSYSECLYVWLLRCSRKRWWTPAVQWTIQ